MGFQHAASASFYEGRSFVQGLIWWFVMGRIGQGLKERYEVPTELPPTLRSLVTESGYFPALAGTRTQACSLGSRNRIGPTLKRTLHATV
jgi:hypothetical protein